MKLLKHYELEGKHAFLSPSKFHWIRYSDEKILESYKKFKAVEHGTKLHELAAMLINEGQRLPDEPKTLNMFVNDAIGFHMNTEQPLKYSDLDREDKMATQAQLRMIESMWREICYYDTDDYAKKSLRKFLRSKFRTDDIMFLTKAKATKVIQAIKSIHKNIKKSAATL